MKRKNEKYFSRKLAIQVCELLQVLTEALKNQCSWNSKTHYPKI